MNTNVKGIRGTGLEDNIMKNGGFIRITNRGAFVVYGSVGYNISGRPYVQNTPQLAVLQSATLCIPCEATNIEFYVYVVLYFQTWTSIFGTTFKTPPKKCYELHGIAFTATCDEVPCVSMMPPMNGDPMQPSISDGCPCEPMPPLISGDCPYKCYCNPFENEEDNNYY